MKWWQIRKRNEDLERELRSALELEEEEQRDRGLSPDEAHYAARRAFGNATLIREQTHESWVLLHSSVSCKTSATLCGNFGDPRGSRQPQFWYWLSESA